MKHKVSSKLQDVKLSSQKVEPSLSREIHSPIRLFKKANPSYNPKDCVIKNLSMLIPEELQNKSIKKESRHQIDYYSESKKYLTFYESSTTIFPSEINDPYSNFSKYIGNFFYLKNLHNVIDNKVQVNAYMNEGKVCFVVKKSWETFDSSDSDANNLQNLENFIRIKYNEFGLMKLVSGCAHSVKPLEFGIIHLPNIKFIVTELLMTYGGEPISDFFNKLKLNEINDIIQQITRGLNYFESYKINHNDIKDRNILLDKILSKINIIRFIDLDIGKNISLTCKSLKPTERRGYSPLYCAPEVYQALQNESDMSEIKYDSFKSQIYSMGVIILFLVGYFPNQKKTSNFDNYKTSEKEYETFYTELQKDISNISENLYKNIMEVAKLCLSYDPEQRLSANELLVILPLLENKTSIEIKRAIQSLILNRNTENYSDKIDQNIEQNSLKEDSQNHSTSQNSSPNYSSQSIQKVSSRLVENMDNLKEKCQLKNELDLLRLEILKEEKLISKINEKLSNKDKEIISEKVKIQNLQEKISKNKGKEVELIIENLNNEKRQLECINNTSKSINKDYEIKLIELEGKLKEETVNLEIYEKNEADFLDIQQKLSSLEKRLIENGITDVSNCSNYYDLAEKLYEKLIELDRSRNPNSKQYCLDKKINSTMIYSGPLKHGKIPHGLGKMYYTDTNIKVIGEFVEGVLKNNLGIFIRSDGTYLLGELINGNSLNPILVYPVFNQTFGKDFYYGDVKNYLMDGNGKYIWENGNYFEGVFKNDRKEGFGKYFYINEGKISQTEEGFWKSNLKEGKFKCTNYPADPFYIEYRGGVQIK